MVKTNTKIKSFFILLVVIGFFLLLPEPTEPISTPEKKDAISESFIKNNLNNNFIIRNVRLYDGEELFEKIDVLIQNNRVFKIGEKLANLTSLPELDAQGKTLLPGLIDAHTHAYGNALQQALNFGVTTELDMFTMPEFANPHQKQREKTDNSKAADLFSATILATAPGGHGTEYGFKIPVLEKPEQADAFVKKRIVQGADYIKAVYNSVEAEHQYSPSISKEILQNLVFNAHQNNKMLVVHVDNLISAKDAIALGADGIIHSFMDKVVDVELIQLMKTNHAFIIPTLSVEASVAQQSDGKRLVRQVVLQRYLNKQQVQQLNSDFPDFGIPATTLKKALDGVKRLSDAGITILAGSDAPNPGTSHGVSLHGELQLLVKAGLTNKQAIHSATGAVSKHFPVGLRGTLKIGSMASMFLVDGNPFEDISRTQHIQAIWKNGTQFIRTKTEDTSVQNQQLTVGMISDFGVSIEQTKIGERIVASTDQLAGGKSEVALSLLTRNSNLLNNQSVNSSSPNQYLQVKGEIKAGFMFPWSGITYLPGPSQQQGVDLSNINFITFEAKAETDTKHFSVLLFQQGSFQPDEKIVELSHSWKTYKITLEDFANTDLSNIVNISIVVTKKRGPFEFMIDDLRFE